MTSYERIINALEGKPTDILPYIDGFNCLEARLSFFGPQVMKAGWEEIALLEAELFQSDWVIIPAPLNIPGGPGIFCDIISEDDTHLLARTFYGGIWYWRKKPYHAKAIYNPVNNLEDWERLSEPDEEKLRKRIRTLREPVKKLKDRGYFVTMEGKGAFEATWMLFRGFENTLMDIVLNPERVKKMSERAVNAIIKLGLMVKEECEVDGIWITDDLGAQKAPYFSPQQYRQIFKDNHRKMVEAFKKAGLKVTFHSHGNIMPLFQDLVEVGFDSIDPLDSYDGMDFPALKKEFGEAVTLKGGISCTIGQMNKEELKEHIGEVVKIGGDRRFILSGAGGVPPEMTLENFNHYRELIYKARRSEL
ncbi:MAG: uroporphyrinogen decarboxylase family protein [Atribacterota bacterium]|nr:uroporphyrinogen decarboxylase family protein [Atribacterota bacterium]